MNRYAIGIDIGSTCAKAAVLSSDREILERLLLPRGWSSVETAEKRKEALGPRLPEAETGVIGAALPAGKGAA